MYSNLITPPDFVSDDFENIVIVNFDQDDIELLGRYLMSADISYNIYVYKSEMDDVEWLNKAIKLSKNVIINCSKKFDLNLDLCSLENSYTVGLPTHKNNVNSILNYFEESKSNK